MTDLKTVIVNALSQCEVHGPDTTISLEEGIPYFDRDGFGTNEPDIIRIKSDETGLTLIDADRLAQAITDHVFNRDRVRDALVNIGFKYDEGFAGSGDLPPRPAEFEFTPHRCSIADDLIDRLIEGLAGKAGEQ